MMITKTTNLITSVAPKNFTRLCIILKISCTFVPCNNSLVMKRVFYFFSFLLVVVAFHSCENEEKTFDETLLYGKWRPISGTSLYFRYDPNGEGVTWNPNVSQKEDEGQAFKWKLAQSELEQRHHIEIIGEDIIIEYYTITVLNATTLRYKNESRTYSFIKID